MNNDRALINSSADKFSRLHPARKLAKVLSSRKMDVSFVVGVFGPWGTGKSSFLAMLREQLAISAEPRFTQADFNPWMFNSKSELIRTFFNTVAKAIAELSVENKSSNGSGRFNFRNKRKNSLSRLDEDFFDLIAKYADGVTDFGTAGANVLRPLGAPGLEVLRERLRRRLVETRKPIVVYIDDIDRLEKDEVYLILKLVKLVGDLPYITYILSFDRGMVASQIADRFGGKNAGNSFLEKIVQLPVSLPPIRKDDFINFWMSELTGVFEELNTSVSEETYARMRNTLENYLYHHQASIRLIFKHCNSLKFALMSLEGEIDLHDLMAIECIRVVAPTLHENIWQNSRDYLDPYSKFDFSGPGVLKSDEDRIAAFMARLKDLEKDLVLNEEDCNNLLELLFPVLRRVFAESTFIDFDAEELLVDLRIGSSRHFEKYFIHQVTGGVITEAEFKSLFDSLADSNNDVLEALVEKYDASTVVSMIIEKRSSYVDSSVIRVVNMVAFLAEKMPDTGVPSFLAGNQSQKAQAARFCVQLLDSNSNQKDFLNRLSTIMESRYDHLFAYEVHAWLRNGKKDLKHKLTEEEYTLLAEIVLNNFRGASSNNSFLLDFEYYGAFMMKVWRATNEKEFNEFLTAYIDRDKNAVIEFLRSVTPTGMSGMLFKSDFTAETYQYARQFLDAKIIAIKLTQLYSDRKLEEAPVWDHFGSTSGLNENLNLARQFMSQHRIATSATGSE